MKINGYLNKVEIKDKYQKCFKNAPGLYNESLVYDKLNIPYVIKNQTITREVFGGDILSSWSDKQKSSLVKRISEFHELPKDGFKTFDWNKYNQYSSELTEKQFNKFQTIINSMNKILVPSHNDINGHNVLWDGEEIKLIDFEWSTLNHPYFDYVNFYIHEDIKLRGDLDRNLWNQILYISLCFFVMWTKEHPESEYVKQLKVRYINLLNGI